ncbi:UNVERIFIED_CONTAM: hypothetical protein FKN15_051187 [Acipenser sinensis]
MTTPALLPISGRRIPTLNPGFSSFPHHRATLRLSEKFILLLILSAFITLCFGAFFFLPDSSKHKRFDLGLEDVLIPHIDSIKEGKHPGGHIIHGQGGHDEHRHREDEEHLRNKIRADHERALEEAKEKLKKSREELRAEIQTEKNKVAQDLKKKDSKLLPPVPMPKLVGIHDGDPGDPDVKEKRDKIRERPIAWRSVVRVKAIPLPTVELSCQVAAHNWSSAARRGGLSSAMVSSAHHAPATPVDWRGACGLACKLPRAALSFDAVALGWLHGRPAE